MKNPRTNKKSKKRLVLATVDQFHVFLSGYMHAKRKTPIRFAASLGISPQLVYMLLNGKRPPSAKILKKLSVEIAYRIRGAPEVIAPDELQMLVVMKMQASKLGLKEYAERLGIHPQTLYTIVAGLRLPPKSLMKKLDLEPVYATR